MSPPTLERVESRLVGESPAMTALRREVLRVARSDAKVLVTGESGSGKEVVAESVHAQSLRSSMPFVAVNCAGLPETLLESELFGHVKGSFTGAYRDKPGKLEMADGGSVFLDEVGEMTLRMQGLLLRFLETGELQKVGADDGGRRVNVRVIAATNRHLRDMISRGAFREDLFYRLNVIHLTVPPLRERREDIPALIQHFLQRLQRAGATAVTDVAPDAMKALTEYGWPGNVRELQNIVERAVVAVERGTIALRDLSDEIRIPEPALARPRRERRRTIADDLVARMKDGKESFWTVVYPLFMSRDITRNDLREIVKKGLAEAHGHYRVVVRLFNMEPSNYKRFLNFLRKHDCQIPFKEYR